MDYLKPSQAIALATLLMITGTTLSGCEWDNSDDYDSTPTTEDTETPDGSTSGETGTDAPDNQNNDGEPDEDTTPPSNQDTLLSGTITTTEAISNALICIDENQNGSCEDEEPQTTSDDTGKWSITGPSGTTIDPNASIIATNNSSTAVMAESGEPADWNFTLSSPVPGAGMDTENISLSPISTLVQTEEESSPLITPDIALKNVASQIGTTEEALRYYVSPPADASPAELAEYERIARIAMAAHELALAIDLQIPDSERAELDPKELNQRIFDQVSDALPTLTQDINETMIEDPDAETYEPGDLISSPEYDDWRVPPSTEPPTPTETEFEARVATAENTSPYFTKSGFEIFPIPNSQLFDFELLPNDLRPGQLYYEARRRVITQTDGDAAEMDLQIAVPRKAWGETSTTFQVISESWCGTSLFDCQTLRSRPIYLRALTWTGFSFATKTIQLGHKGTQNVLVMNELGDLVASSPSNGFSTSMTLRELSLDGLDGRDALKELTGISVPETASWSFGGEAKAYTFTETLTSDVILSQWPAGGTGNLCPSPGLPDASITGSCNLVYGESGRSTGMPAHTFADILYPVSEQTTTYNGTFENGKPADALLLSGPTPEPYVARLFGSSNDEEGIIVIDRLTANGWETISLTGRWEKTIAPFPRVELFLPGGLTYTDARIGFHLGRAYLFERQGYLRHGWSINKEINLDTLFNRKQIKFLINQQAFNETVAGLESGGILVEHPFYSAIIDAQEEEAAKNDNE